MCLQFDVVLNFSDDCRMLFAFFFSHREMSDELRYVCMYLSYGIVCCRATVNGIRTSAFIVSVRLTSASLRFLLIIYLFKLRVVLTYFTSHINVLFVLVNY